MTTEQNTTDGFAINAIMLSRLGENLAHIAQFMQTHTRGMIVASGPMRGGKTITLIAIIAGLSVPMLRIKPKRDDRQKGIRTHTGIEVDAFSVTTVEELKGLVRAHRPQVILADEWQFASAELAQALIELACNCVVIVGMLNMTFDPREWEAHRILREQGPKCLSLSYMHLSLVGICQRCGSPQATHSALTIPPPTDGGSVLTGADVYLTVCSTCHTPPPS